MAYGSASGVAWPGVIAITDERIPMTASHSLPHPVEFVEVGSEVTDLMTFPPPSTCDTCERRLTYQAHHTPGYQLWVLECPWCSVAPGGVEPPTS